MADERVMITYLTRLCLVILVFAVLNGLGANPGYNVAMALFGLFVAYSRDPQVNFMFGLTLAFTLVIDITWASLYGKDLSHAGGTHAFALAMHCIVLILKVPVLAVVYLLYSHYGGAYSDRFAQSNGNGSGHNQQPAPSANNFAPPPSGPYQASLDSSPFAP